MNCTRRFKESCNLTALFIFTNSFKKHLGLLSFQTDPKLDKEICMLNSPSRVFENIVYPTHLKPWDSRPSATFPESHGFPFSECCGCCGCWSHRNLDPSRPALGLLIGEALLHSRVVPPTLKELGTPGAPETSETSATAAGSGAVKFAIRLSFDSNLSNA